MNYVYLGIVGLLLFLWWNSIRGLVLKKWFIIIYAPPGNCKSIEQARLSEKLVKEYYKIQKRYPFLRRRYLFTNQELNLSNKWFKKAYAEGLLRFWKEPDQLRYCATPKCFLGDSLHKLHDCDIFCDEGATIFPATGRSSGDDMKPWQRELCTLHRHYSVRIVLLTVDFMAINITARRVAWDAWMMTKVIGSRDPSPSLPPIKFIWGIYNQRRIDVDLLKKDAIEVRLIVKESDKTTENSQEETKRTIYERIKMIGKPRLHLITRHKCSLYDTLQKY